VHNNITAHAGIFKMPWGFFWGVFKFAVPPEKCKSMRSGPYPTASSGVALFLFIIDGLEAEYDGKDGPVDGEDVAGLPPRRHSDTVI
jgi:hypothetical protein